MGSVEEAVATGTRALVRQRVLAERVLAIVRLRDGTQLEEVAQALVDGGITILEFTLTTPGALAAIARCRARFGDAVLVGAGTVLSVEAVQQSVEAGAQFVVSPGFDAAVIEAAHRGGAAAMPGALTPTEILTAWRAGGDVIKVFPARTFGPRYLSDVLAPLPEILLMPTGGVDETTAVAYLRAGAVAVAAGGNLIDATAVARHDWAALTARARTLIDAIKNG